jgi:hypothetical protein
MAIIRQFTVRLGTTVLVMGALGCTQTPMWDPGAPDPMTVEHYVLARTAVDAHSKPDAQAAFYLLRSDVMRMRTNTLALQSALARLYRASNNVDKEDWSAANSSLLSLQRDFGRP